jgi:ketosteroid isomerase-like protein
LSCLNQLLNNIKEGKMKANNKLVQLTPVILLLFVGMLGCKENTETNKAASPEELSQMNKDFAAALNNKNATAASLLYAEDASLLPPNEQIVTGRDNIKKYWQAALDAGTSDVSVSTISTGCNGDLGYEIGRFQLSYPDAHGKMVVEIGKYTEILKRTANGKWISIYGMWNSDPSLRNDKMD